MSENPGPDFESFDTSDTFDAKAEDFSSEAHLDESLRAEQVASANHDAGQPSGEAQQGGNWQEPSLETLSAAVTRAAQEAGYAVAGFASYVGEKAKGLYEEQRRSYFAAHPEKADTKEGQNFLNSLQSQLGKLVEETTKAYQDFVERGRDTVSGLRSQQRTDAAPAEQVVIENPPADQDRPGEQTEGDQPNR